jgi:beta-lactam-binding protein with PASTA domain
MKQTLSFIWRNNRLRDTAIVLLGTVVILYLLLLLVDRLIMPIIVHRGGTSVVPNLIDLSLHEADSLLADAGLNLQVWAEEYEPTKPPETILSQIPPPHTKIKEGRSVKVKVSKAEEAVLVPKLKGISIRQAELLLAQVGLELGETIWIPSDSFPKDVVIANTPSSGVSVPSGISVNLKVSLGVEADTVVVPDLVGMNLEESKKILREIGLQLGNTKIKVNNDFLPGTILNQSLPAGEKIARGSEIELEVSATE